MVELFSGEEELWLSICMILLSLICLGFPIAVILERLRDRKLIRWLVEHAEELAEGAEGPGGVVYGFDTELVRYEANLSLVVISTGLQSGFYQRGSNHLIPKTLYTLFTLVFGWWMFDPQLWLQNTAAIANNLSDSNVITVGELFEPEAEE